MNPYLGLSLTVLFLAVNAFFVAAEFAVTSSRRSAVEPLADRGARGAQKALYALEHVSVMLATCQLGITIMSTSLGVIAEPALAHLISTPLAALGISKAGAHAVAFVLALLIVLFLHVAFAEMVPKNISISNPQKVLLVLAPILVALGRLFGPIVIGLDRLANAFLRMFGVEPKSEISAVFTAQEVASIVALSQQEGKLNDELGLLSGTLEFTEETAATLMVPADGLVAMTEPVVPVDVEALVAKTGFSRFPVANADGDLIGYVHLKDVLYAEGGDRDAPVPPWRVRELGSVPATTEAEDALRIMQRDAAHMLAVTKGPTDHTVVGVLFLEDLLEELVGQVRDSLQRRGW